MNDRLKVLVIDDEELKARNIIKALKEVLGDIEVDRKKNRNDGLYAIKTHHDSHDEYDIIITDNYMPLRKDTKTIEPFATDIVYQAEMIGATGVKIICTSGLIGVCEADYYVVTYDSSAALDNKFRSILRRKGFRVIS